MSGGLSRSDSPLIVSLSKHERRRPRRRGRRFISQGVVMRTRFGSVAVGLSILSVGCLWWLARLSGATGCDRAGVSRAAATRRRRSPLTAGSSPSRGAAPRRAARPTSLRRSAATAARAFGAPVRVNNIDGDARLNGEQPPHVALVPRAGREPAIVVVWTTKGANGTTLLQSRSDDGGRSFSAAVLVPGTDAPGNRGWEAIAVRPGGRVDVAWLDHRELARDPAMAASHHDHKSADKPDGVAMAQKSKLFFASLDGAAAPRAVTGGVCYCCKTALVRAGEAVYAAWRHVYPGTFATWRSRCRVTMAARSRRRCESARTSGRSKAVRTTAPRWRWTRRTASISCGRRWSSGCGRAGADPNIALFYAMSTDGKQFTARERIPTEGMPHHPRIAAGADGSLTVAWDELAGGVRRVAIGRGTADGAGRPRFRRELLTTAGSGVYPAIAVASDGVVAAWTSGASTSIQVRRLAGPEERRPIDEIDASAAGRIAIALSSVRARARRPPAHSVEASRPPLGRRRRVLQAPCAWPDVSDASQVPVRRTARTVLDVRLQSERRGARVPARVLRFLAVSRRVRFRRPNRSHRVTVVVDAGSLAAPFPAASRLAPLTTT